MKAIGEEIEAIRKEMGKRLVILGHHYQRPLVLGHADEIGDSLELARKAAARTDAEKIVMCGVKFMAESACILAGPDQTVYMPDVSAGCPMANMADAAAMERAWDALQKAGKKDWLPVVYVNSSAEIKALCGRWGGSTCTSSNAQKVFEWVFRQGKRVFFLPDEHLGRNSAHDLRVPDDEVLMYDPWAEDGGLEKDAIARSRVVVWKGFCLVHTAFTPEQVKDIRQRYPHAKIIVHPEAPLEVVRLADAHGSTSQIIKYVQESTAGAMIVIGTEVNLVSRLAEEQRGRVSVKSLLQSACANMGRTNERNLLALLKGWAKENEIHVADEVRAEARKALERMLGI